MHNTDEFTTFLLQEYNNIANAHFNLTNTITSFFKQYILVMTIPITLITFAANYSTGDSEGLYQFPQLIIFFTLFLYLVGFSIMLYIVNLRLDSILYARSVNGIRCYFYGKANLSPAQECTYRVLPTRKDKPDLTTNIWPMIFVFFLFNTGYPVFAICLFYQNTCLAIFSSLLSFILHITVVVVLRAKKENFCREVS